MTEHQERSTKEWRPTATSEIVQLRARILHETREYFRRKRVLEVETPNLVARTVTDVHIESVPVSLSKGADAGAWLHTSPEYHMKRLLAAGMGDIYQICKVFRDSEHGRWHHPEFTLVEWYRVGLDHLELMDDVDDLLHQLFTGRLPLESSDKMNYRDAFSRHAGTDPFETDTEALGVCAREAGLDVANPAGLDRSGWLDLVFSGLVAPHFARDRLTFIYDYPVEQAALSRIRPDPQPVAERFEVFLGPVELANGFHELTDATEQRQRFETDLQNRRAADRRLPDIDERFLAALKSGLPDCSGVAVGLDRVVMLAGRARNISDTLVFPGPRA